MAEITRDAIDGDSITDKQARQGEANVTLTDPFGTTVTVSAARAEVLEARGYTRGGTRSRTSRTSARAQASGGVPEGTVDDVNAWIGDDSDRARAALEAEGQDGRKGVIDYAERVLADDEA